MEKKTKKKSSIIFQFKSLIIHQGEKKTKEIDAMLEKLFEYIKIKRASTKIIK